MAAKALEFAILTATRTGETRDAKWDEIDLDQKVWTIQAARTKAAREHRVPLSGRALEILEAMARVRDDSEVVFQGRRGRPLGRNALKQALEELRVGMRSCFRDWAGNETTFPRELCEQALAHAIGDASEQAYRRSDALERRRALMAAWAACCDRPAEGGKVIALNR